MEQKSTDDNMSLENNTEKKEWKKPEISEISEINETENSFTGSDDGSTYS